MWIVLICFVCLQRGVPTATVGINNSTNAALLAVRILGSFVPEYQEKMRKYQLEMEEQVIVKGDKLRQEGDVAYLAGMASKGK
jgi:phosphoribosylaminoimidazole carboxylase